MRLPWCLALLGLMLLVWAPVGIAAEGDGPTLTPAGPDEWDYRSETPSLRSIAANLQGTLRAESERLAEIQYWVERPKINELIRGLAEGNAGDCAAGCVAHKTEQTRAGGESLNEAVTLSAQEVALIANLNPSPSFLRAYGASAWAAQETFNKGVVESGGESMMGILLGNVSNRDAPAQSDARGFPELDDNPEDQWFMNPFTLMAGGGMFAYEIAEDLDRAASDLTRLARRAQAQTDQKLHLAAQMRPGGVANVGGVEGLLFSTPLLNQPMSGTAADGIDGTITGAQIVVDPDRNLIVKHRTEGTMTRNGETQEFFIEVVNSDFRNPPGCGDLLVPFRRTNRIGGVMTEAEREQMAEAQAQLAEFEQQMASMPPQQRQMMESMMGSQMQAVRSLASGGAMETTHEIEEVYCNPDLAALFGTGMGTGPMEAYDLVLIQEYLLILGYEPGNTEGVLDTLTEIAISTFQAERGMAVTGQPSLALQQALAAEMG